MSSRHLCRTIALQTLYEFDFLRLDQEAIETKGPEILARNIQEFGHDLDGQQEFVKTLVDGVRKNLSAIDDYIKNYASQWPLEQITLIDRNILRLGVFEMIFSQETPPKIAINEAIVVAKSFGGTASGKFINGVLGAIYEDLKKNSQSWC